MEFLAGLHSKVIHFPIACFVLYTLFEIAGTVLDKKNLSTTAYILLVIGVFSCVAAVLTGNQAHEVAEKLIDKGISIPTDLINEHEQYATITLWYFFFLLVVRTISIIKKRFTKSVQLGFILLAMLGCYFLYEAGDHGGKLVYKYGVGTEIIKNYK
ncbi:MAG: hypothetical protein A2068_03485 [Ignavibacteria bacterium GWB2_35_6b]|nr:MAG: hypothetical protein A2068_03485 [Ignavibacteria bacterium GWB2_35_6b]